MEEQRAERAFTVAVMVIAALVGVFLVNFGPARLGPTSSPSVAIGPVTTTTSTLPVASTTVAPPTSTVVPTTTAAAASDPGSLPQTTDEPTATGATFTDGAQGLWNAIAHDNPALGMPFFFPKSAYQQVKAIADPASDYENRLIANYEQDIHSLHAQLGADAASAKFTGIDVPTAQAVLVQPGEESNKLPYWRVYGTTLQYTLNGTSGTLPVTSMISWRGEWYVVHLGAIR